MDGPVSPSRQSFGFQFADNPRPILIRSLLRWARQLLADEAAAAREAQDPAAMVALARQTIDLCVLAVLVEAHKKVPDDCFFYGRLPEKMYVDGLAAYRNVLGLDHGPARILVDRVEDHPGWRVSDGELVVKSAAGIVRNFMARYAPELIEEEDTAALPPPEAVPTPAWVHKAQEALGLDDTDFG